MGVGRNQLKKKRAVSEVALCCCPKCMRSFLLEKKTPKDSIALLFECNIWDNCPKGLIFPNESEFIIKQATKQYLGFWFSPLIIKTHCLPSSIFIEHLQCTRHNRTYKKTLSLLLRSLHSKRKKIHLF